MELHEIIKYLGNDCSPAELKELEAWKASSAENEALFSRVKEVWEASQKTPDSLSPDFEKAWENIKAQTGIQERRTKQVSMSVSVRYLMRIAAAVVILVGLGLLSRTFFLSKPAMKMELTQDIPKKEIHLADGSVITLNRNSRIIFPEKFNAAIREVTLEGEAFFKVAKDPEHPFIVHANGTTVRVLGTSFDIKIKGEEQVQVSVLTGKVAFQSGNHASIFLVKGEQGSFDKRTQQMSKQTLTDENFLAWETGVLTFRNKSLLQAAQVMADYYSSTIEVDPALQNRVITVTFNNQPLPEALEILKMTLSIDIQHMAGKIILKPLENQQP